MTCTYFRYSQENLLNTPYIQLLKTIHNISFALHPSTLFPIFNTPLWDHTENEKNIDPLGHPRHPNLFFFEAHNLPLLTIFKTQNGKNILHFPTKVLGALLSNYFLAYTVQPTESNLFHPPENKPCLIP